MQIATAEVTTKGEATPAVACHIGPNKVVATGSWLKIGRVFDEEWLEGNPVPDPMGMVDSLRSSAFAADIFTFAQTFPDGVKHHEFHCEWDSLAVACTTNFDAWWNGLPQESRKNVRKFQKRGGVIRTVDFDEDLVRRIKELYDEMPVRQGRKFWHYGKDIARVRRDNATYLERSQFICAFVGDEMVGFIKLVKVGRTARIMQILAKNAHQDKHPMNALLAAAVEACSKRGIEHLIYAMYVYGNKKSSSVTEFKRRNGFHPMPAPRYYIPLTLKGRVAMALKLHLPMTHVLPERLLNILLEIRARLHAKRARA